jgi:RNA polymerase sigma-70 factor (ECF subfamily)
MRGSSLASVDDRLSRRREKFHAVSASQARLRAMVDEHSGFVTRVLRRAGVPPSDLDDEVQRTFIVAARRLDDVEVGSERSFLVQVAHNVAFHARRTLRRRRDVLDGPPPELIEVLATPEFLTDRKRTHEVLDQIIGSLPEPLRRAFILFEFDGMNLSEIARALRIPRGTAASRLRRARAQLREHVAASELAGDLGVATVPPRGPKLLRRARVSSLERALLVAGTAAHAPQTTYVKLVAALGLAPRGSSLTR